MDWYDANRMAQGQQINNTTWRHKKMKAGAKIY